MELFLSPWNYISASALHTDSLFPKAVNNVMCFLMCVQWAAPAFWSVNLLTYPHQLLRRCNSRVLTLCGIWPVSSLSVAGEEGTIKHHTQWYNNVWRASDGELVSGTKGRAGLIIHESSAGAMQRPAPLYLFIWHLLLCHEIISAQLRMLHALWTFRSFAFDTLLMRVAFRRGKTTAQLLEWHSHA